LTAVGPGAASAFDRDLDGCTFDVSRDRLFVLLEGEQYLARVNPQSDNAVLFSDATFGTGPVLRHARMDGDPARGVLYLSVGGGIAAVDAESGFRVLLALIGTRTAGDL
jgi:hypothetical protein